MTNDSRQVSEAKVASTIRRRRPAWPLLLLGAVIVLAAGVAGGYYGAVRFASSLTTAQTAEEIYTCPMHPQVEQVGPGTCPICFMDLVPKGGGLPSSQDEDHGAHDLQITPRDRIVADVSTVPAEYRMLTTSITAPVTIDFNEATQRVVSARVAGRIERLFVRETGLPVSKGSALMEIYSPELVAAQNEFLVARETARTLSQPVGDLYRSDSSARLARGRGVIESARRRLSLLGLTDLQIGALEKRGEVTSVVTVYSPVSGIVLRRGVAEGAYVNEGTMLIEVVEIGTVWGMIDAPQDVASRLNVGMETVIRGAGLGSDIVHARIDYIYPTADASSRTIRLRAPIPNYRGLMRPGMVFTADIQIPSVDALALPVSSVIRTGARDLVYVEVSKNTFEARTVTVGIRSGDYYQIVGGDLKRGDKVVAEGGYLLDSERQLRGIEGGK